jgi:hypothetical protein
MNSSYELQFLLVHHNLCLVLKWLKPNGWATFSKCGARLNDFVLGPLFANDLTIGFYATCKRPIMKFYLQHVILSMQEVGLWKEKSVPTLLLLF